MISKLFLFLFILFNSAVYGEEEFTPELVYMVGMVNKSFAESESSIEGENKVPAASGNAQVIAAAIQYKFQSSAKRSYYSNFVVPLLPSGDNSFFSGGMGVEFYLNDLGSNMKFQDGSDMIRVSPKLTYFWGLEAHVDYLVYVTETQKKSDIGFDLGATFGGSYRVSRSVNLKMLLGLSKVTGVNTSGMGMKVMFGYVHHLGN